MKGPFARALKQTHEGLQSLKGSPRDLYIVYAINACDNFNYFSLSLLFTLYLTEEFGFSDQETGVLYGLWGCAITAFGFAFGGVVDFLGVKKTLFIAFILTGSGRLLLALSHSKWLLLTAIFGPVSLGLAFGSPAVLIAVKRYTKEGNRGFAYAVLYAAMNVASLLSGWTLDLFRITLRDGFAIQGQPADSVLNSGYRLYLVLGCFAAGTGFLLNFTIREHPPGTKHHSRTSTSGTDRPLAPDQHRLTDDGGSSMSLPGKAVLKGDDKAHVAESLTPRRQEQDSQQSSLPQTPEPQPLLGAMAQIKVLTYTLRLGTFQRVQEIQAMCIITVNLKAIFRHLDATLPKYQVRSFGCDAPVGTVYSINPAMIMTLVPLVGAAATHYSHFDMIHYGSYVSALSPLWMALFTTEWATVLFVVQLSLGESIWSPRWYDYSMSVAPEGREGIFTAMASAPLFLGKFVTGTASGYLLGRFCPNDGVNCGEPNPGPQIAGYHCQGHMLWLIITLLTCMSPFGILLFQKWLRPAAKAELLSSQDEEAQQPSGSAYIDVPSRRHSSQDRLASSVVLQEAGVGWEETTQLLQGQISRFVSRDDSDLSNNELQQSPGQPLSRSVSI
ncbi:MAG: hypothetical protein FRX49_09101 [Trebouxia sp. A1-2]|nr:MAG: hypothetical protein FRX49_09101 [Trebouxia sp. A1-2]